MDIFHTWVEALFIAVLVAGFVLALFINNAAISYAVIFLCGAIFGKALFHQKKDFYFPCVLLTVGFIVGYLLGNRAGNVLTIIILFALGNFLSYFVHEKGLF